MKNHGLCGKRLRIAGDAGAPIVSFSISFMPPQAAFVSIFDYDLTAFVPMTAL